MKQTWKLGCLLVLGLGSLSFIAANEAIGDASRQNEGVDVDRQVEKRERRRDDRWDACKQDGEKFCKGIEPGEGRIIECMREHKSEFSDACKALMSEKREKRREFRKERKEKHEGQEACKEDGEKFCKDVKPGEGRIIRCLKEHQSELSSDCAEMMTKKGKRDSEKDRK